MIVYIYTHTITQHNIDMQGVYPASGLPGSDDSATRQPESQVLGERYWTMQQAEV